MREGREPVLRVTMLPRDTNARGTIFGIYPLAERNRKSRQEEIGLVVQHHKRFDNTYEWQDLY